MRGWSWEPNLSLLGGLSIFLFRYLGLTPQVRAIGIISSPRRGRQMVSPGCEPRILRSASAQSQRKPRILPYIVDGDLREPRVRAIGINSSPRRGRQMDSPGCKPRILLERGVNYVRHI